jgi:ribose transport system ATP-binding protein
MTPILALEQVSKQYPGVIALDRVDFSLERGEVRALLGKNGAGKSTLVKVLSGAVHPDSGTIRIDGQPVTIADPQDAFKQGIYTVYQEMSLVPGLTVAENILLGRWPRQNLLGLKVINRSKVRPIAKAALDQLEVSLNLDQEVGRLSVANQQLVEIAKALSMSPRVLVLDEPTSALASGEVDVLHRVVRRLAEQGQAIIYVTHRLQEIPHVADNVTVLRDGRLVGTITSQEATPARIAQMMIGSDWQRTKRGGHAEVSDVKLAVKNLSRGDLLKDISFEVRGGEVLGLAGLLGSGRTELVRAIFGLDRVDNGEIYVNGQKVTNPTPESMKNNRVGLTPEDRKRQGLVLPFSVRDNLTMASMDRYSVSGVLQRARANEMASSMVQSMAIKTPGLHVAAQTLSGGNQQKVVVGNWLNTLPEVLLMDEPTRGIDIQAKEQIFSLVRDLAAQGLAVVFISSEIEEVLDVADRILVMHEGRITAEVNPDEVDLERLLAMVMEETEQ